MYVGGGEGGRGAEYKERVGRERKNSDDIASRRTLTGNVLCGKKGPHGHCHLPGFKTLLLGKKSAKKLAHASIFFVTI